jgi:hypothetical protein
MKNSTAGWMRLALGLVPVACILLGAASASPNLPQSRAKKQVFTEDDLKVERLRGRAMVAAMIDRTQLDDPSSPAVVNAVNTATGQGKYSGRIKLTEVKIGNRSSKLIRAIQLRWAITDRSEKAAVLLEGATPFFDVLIKPGAEPVVEIPPIYLNQVVKPVLKGGELNGDIYVVVGVQEVRFADGTSWQRVPSSSSLKGRPPGSWSSGSGFRSPESATAPHLTAREGRQARGA